MTFLDYATQVSELSKIARLTGAEPRIVGGLPPLAAQPSTSACLVCGARPARACAACGAVSYCGELHQRQDARFHEDVCGALATVAEDQRLFAEESLEDAVTELLARRRGDQDVRSLSGWSGWDDFLRTEGLAPARRRRLSDLATCALTLASLAAKLEVTPQKPERLVVHAMAASPREQRMPPDVWAEAARLLSLTHLELLLVGPELNDAEPDAHHPRVSLRARKGLYGRELWNELGRPDLIVGYDCGLLMYPTWKPTILGLRGAGVPFVITSFRGWEADAEARLLTAVRAQCLLPPRPNPWASLAAKRSTTIVNDVSYDNAFVSAWR